MRDFLKKYGHAWTVLYIFIYMPWFTWLEKTVVDYTPVHTRLDDVIPFCEYFVIPYFIWFIFIPGVFIFFFFKSKEEYYRLSAFLFIGMSICLFICTVWHNGQELRMNFDTGKNIFTKIVAGLYKADTNTNVFPSIHVFNSVGACIAIVKSKVIPKRHWVKTATTVLVVLICASTVFLKQHSLIDVAGGIILAGIMYIFVYVLEPSFKTRRERAKEKQTA